MKRFHLKLLVGLLAFFALVFLGMWVYEPLRVWYYARAYKSETDARQRIRIVGILCKSERGKKALYDAFRERCISEMVKIPAGSFMMGSKNGYEIEKPEHEVYLDRFKIGKVEVTNEKYYVFVKLANGKPARCWKDGKIPTHKANHPVSSIDWFEADHYCLWLGMSLPSEAQWEYACRSGSLSKYCFGNDPARLAEYAWYKKNSGGETNPVGQKKPNNWGLYDMHGNVLEWCQDFCDFRYYSKSPRRNPKGPEEGISRILRGGSYNCKADHCRSSIRYADREACGHYGFRVCCPHPKPGEQK